MGPYFQIYKFWSAGGSWTAKIGKSHWTALVVNDKRLTLPQLPKILRKLKNKCFLIFANIICVGFEFQKFHSRSRQILPILQLYIENKGKIGSRAYVKIIVKN